MAEEALRGNYISNVQLEEAKRTQEKFGALGLARRSLGEIFLQRGDLTRNELRDLYRKVAPSVGLPRIDGYQVVAKIGEGGMGAVYEATQDSMDRRVALKVLHPSLADDELYLRRFVREARIAALLNHPNIVAGIDVGECQGLHYFVMEFVEGRTVKELVREAGSLAQRPAFEIAHQVARALERAARHNLVHRDIKPENILVVETSTGESEGRIAKLCDLGLARPEGGDDTLTQSGATHGTPYYMSPEQACGEALDVRSDIYALGVTLYEMVTGLRPFTGRTAAEVLVRQISENPEPPRSHAPDLSPGAEQVILRMLAKRPEGRYQTASVLANDLKAVAHGRRPAGEGPVASPTQRLTSDSMPAALRQARAAGVSAPAPGPSLAVVALAIYALIVTVLWLLGIGSVPVEAPGSSGSGSSADAGSHVGIGSSAPVKTRPADFAARRLYEAALAYEKSRKEELAPSNPDRGLVRAEVLRRYRDVIARFGTEHAFWAHKARDQIEALGAAESRARRASLEALRARVRSANRQQQWAVAARVIASFDWPEEWADQRARLELEIAETAAERQAALVTHAARLVERGDPMAAIEKLERFAAQRPPVDLAPALELLVLLRRDVASDAIRRGELLHESRDGKLHAAVAWLRPLLARHRFGEAAKALRLRATETRDTQLARRLRWTAGLIARADDVPRAALSALKRAAVRRQKIKVYGAGRMPMDAVLHGVEKRGVLIEVDGHQLPIPLANQPAAWVLGWASKADDKAQTESLAAFEFCAGRWLAAQQRLSSIDSPLVALVEQLRFYEAALEMSRFRQLRAARAKGAELLALVEELISGYADAPSVAPQLPQLHALRVSLREKEANALIAPKGKVLSRDASGTKVRYTFRSSAELSDWRLSGWRRGKRSALLTRKRGARATYRYRLRPEGARLDLELHFLVGGKPGAAIDWLEGGRTMRLVFSDDGLVRLLQIVAGKQSVIAQRKRDELNHGQYNVTVWYDHKSVQLEVDGRVTLAVALDRPLSPGRIELRATAGPLKIRHALFSARLLHDDKEKGGGK